MVDLYTELKLDPRASFAAIQDELRRLEQLWRRREINSPERATEMLALINQAKKVFASSSSKATYDRELENSQKKPVASDPQVERYQQWKKWYDQAIDHANKKQWDLAKAAIEKAMSYYSQEQDDAQFLNVVATIYRENRDYTTALTYINKAIVIDGTVADFYITKGLIYSSIYEDTDTYVKDRNKIHSSEIETYKLAVQKVNNDGNKRTQGLAYSLLAYAMSRTIRGQKEQYSNSPQSTIEAESKKYAIKAVECGDPWGLADTVLHSIDVIEQQRNDMIKNQEREKQLRAEREKKERDRQRRLDQSSLFDLMDEFISEDVLDTEAKRNEAAEHRRKIDDYINKLNIMERVKEAAIHYARGLRNEYARGLTQGNTRLNKNIPSAVGDIITTNDICKILGFSYIPAELHDGIGEELQSKYYGEGEYKWYVILFYKKGNHSTLYSTQYGEEYIQTIKRVLSQLEKDGQITFQLEDYIHYSPTTNNDSDRILSLSERNRGPLVTIQATNNTIRMLKKRGIEIQGAIQQQSTHAEKPIVNKQNIKRQATISTIVFAAISVLIFAIWFVSVTPHMINATPISLIELIFWCGIFIAWSSFIRFRRSGSILPVIVAVVMNVMTGLCFFDGGKNNALDGRLWITWLIAGALHTILTIVTG